MKNRHYKLIYMAVPLLCLLLSSCDALLDDQVTDFGTGPDFVGFAKSTISVSTPANGDEAEKTIPVKLIGPDVESMTGEITVNVSVDPSSTAVEGVNYNLGSSSVVLNEENNYQASLPITLITEGINPPLDEAPYLVLNIDEINANGDIVINGKTESTKVTINYLCNSDLEGKYSVTTTYLYHDFLPDYATNTMDMTVTSEEYGVYTVPDISGGLYSSGPYSTGYGTSGVEFTFSDLCDNISWEGQHDPWGAITPLAGGVNEVNPETGVFTISWHNEAYGEEGISVFTPID